MKKRFLAGFLPAAGVLLLLAVASGCATLPNCSLLLPDPVIPQGDNVIQIIADGDTVRDAAYQSLFKTKNWPIGYCQAMEADKYYRYVLENLEPHNAYAMVNRGYLALMRAYGARGREREIQLNSAYARFKDALKLRPGYVPAHMYIGEYYILRREYTSATEEYQKLLDAGVENSYICSWAGFALKKMGRTTEAKQMFRKAVERGDREESSAWSRKNM